MQFKQQTQIGVKTWYGKTEVNCRTDGAAHDIAKEILILYFCKMFDIFAKGNIMSELVKTLLQQLNVMLKMNGFNTQVCRRFFDTKSD